MNAWWARTCDWLDRFVWNGAVQVVSYTVLDLHGWIGLWTNILSMWDSIRAAIGCGEEAGFLASAGWSGAVLSEDDWGSPRGSGVLLSWGCRP